MKWLKRIGIALVVLLVIAAAIPFFVNLDDFISTTPTWETQFKFLPLCPHLTCNGPQHVS